MIFEYLSQKLEGTEMVSFDRQESVVPDVITKDSTKRVIVPEKFRADVEALERYAESALKTGLCITLSLSELLLICPRERRRTDAYTSLIRFLQDEINVTLNINSNKTRKKA